jgi:hypothetical protein
VKHYTVIVELEVKVLAKNPRAVDRILDESHFVAQRSKAKTAGGLHVERVLKCSQYHHER